MKLKTLSAICGGLAALGIATVITLGCVAPKKDYYKMPIIPTGIAASLCGGMLGLAKNKEDARNYQGRLDYQI